MRSLPKLPYDNSVAVLTSMHGKERVIGPILQAELGLIVGLAMGVNTDQFGTFSREIERSGSQLDAVRAKIAAGFDYAPLARVGLASEGSFGPHPVVPLITVAREVVMLVDRESGLELTGHDNSLETNFGHIAVRDLEPAVAFAQRVGFPEHGLIVMGYKDDQPAPELLLCKDITASDTLKAAVKEAVGICGSAFVETDMRAHHNPTRMRAIERATRDLVRRFHSRCPQCDYPGFDVTRRIRGLPCALCGQPTNVARADVLTCASCRFQVERPVTTNQTADAERCSNCNP